MSSELRSCPPLPGVLVVEEEAGLFVPEEERSLCADLDRLGVDSALLSSNLMVVLILNPAFPSPSASPLSFCFSPGKLGVN